MSRNTQRPALSSQLKVLAMRPSRLRCKFMDSQPQSFESGPLMQPKPTTTRDDVKIAIMALAMHLHCAYTAHSKEAFADPFMILQMRWPRLSESTATCPFCGGQHNLCAKSERLCTNPPLDPVFECYTWWKQHLADSSTKMACAEESSTLAAAGLHGFHHSGVSLHLHPK